MNKWLTIPILLLCMSATEALPPSPPVSSPIHSPKHSELVQSLGSPMVVAAPIAPAVVVPPSTMTLVWDYPSNDVASVQFEVWGASTITNGPPLVHYDDVPTGFSLYQVTDTPTAIVPKGVMGFFIIRARDRVTGIVSYWNQ